MDPHIKQGLIDKIEHWERTCSDQFYDSRNQEQADELLVQRLSGYSHDEIVYNYNFLKESRPIERNYHACQQHFMDAFNNQYKRQHHDPE